MPHQEISGGSGFRQHPKCNEISQDLVVHFERRHLHDQQNIYLCIDGQRNLDKGVSYMKSNLHTPMSKHRVDHGQVPH